MKTFKLALLIVPLLALGCRVNPNEMYLERESRMLEDRIYELENCLDDCNAAREATIRENESLKKELARDGEPSSAPSAIERKPKASSGPSYAPPSIELPSGSAPRSRARGKQEFEAPTIEMPEPSDTPPSTLPSDKPPSAAVQGAPTVLVINDDLTGGMDRDGQDGDEGITVVVEPHDETGRLVNGAAMVSFVVLDPAEQGPQARVARWDFASDAVRSHFQDTAFGRGLQFELPWPHDRPKHRDLQLFVRLTTPGGDKLVADTKLQVRAAGDAPREGRQPKSWSAAQNAHRPARSRPTPEARIPAATPVAPRRQVATSQDDRDGSDRDGEGIREASRSGRPVWTPFR